MNGVKTEFRFFTVSDWKQEETYLREQHKNGWEFVKVNFISLYHFRKCEPADVVYQLDYHPESITHKEAYIQMFRDCGWEYLQNYCGYSYFRKSVSEMDGEEEIFCDDDSRLDMMKRVFKQRIIPLLLIFFLLIIPQIFIQSRIDTPENHILMLVFCVLSGLYLTLFIKFAIRFRNCFQSASN